MGYDSGMSLVENLQATAQRLLASYATGDVQSVTITVTPAANEWEMPTTTTERTPIDAFVTGIAEKYIDGTRIVATDRMAIVAADVVIVNGDTVTVDGKPVEVVQVVPIPAAGVAAIKKLVIRG